RRDRHGGRHCKLEAVMAFPRRTVLRYLRLCARLRSSLCSPQSCCRVCRSGLRVHASKPMQLQSHLYSRPIARRRQVQVSTEVDARARSVRSGATGRTLRIPDDVVFEAILPELCNSRPALSTIGFLPTGMSCGGTIVLTRLGVAYEITVNWLTGGVEVGSRHAL